MSHRKTLTAFCLGAAVAAAASFALQVNFATAQVGANQPHMQAALAALITARGELRAAVANKGGHRVKALQLVDGAIAEVQTGMAVAD
jgi:hypothetical protein